MLQVIAKNSNLKEKSEKNSFFTKQYTNIAKGVAVLLLLFHHLGLNPELNLFNPNDILYKLAEQCKVCVAIFIILSGYGLNASFNKKINEKPYCVKTIKFSIRHLFKLMLSYWIIFSIFVLFGHFTGMRNINEIYGESLLKNIFIDFLGVADFFKTPTYNATWWFMSLIIILYIIFPILKILLKRVPVLLILSTLCITQFNLFGFYPNLNTYLFAFCLGMFLSEFFVFDKIKNIHKTKVEEIISAIIILILGLYTRYKLGGVFDTFAAFSIICFCNSVLARFGSIIKNVFAFLGRHSSNIFMMHTFIYKYFFSRIFCKSKILVFNVWNVTSNNINNFSNNRIFKEKYRKNWKKIIFKNSIIKDD